MYGWGGTTPQPPLIDNPLGSHSHPLERMSDMNISTISSPSQAFSVSAVNMRSMMSIQVMDLAQSAYEDAAAQLIGIMNAMTGVGQNIDIMA